MAAEAPHIPTAPPVNTPKRFCKPSALAKTTPRPIVLPIATINNTAVCQPSAAKSPNAMRNPNNATPIRKIWRAVNSIPSLHVVPSYKNDIAMPNSKANNIAGAP